MQKIIIIYDLLVWSKFGLIQFSAGLGLNRKIFANERIEVLGTEIKTSHLAHHAMNFLAHFHISQMFKYFKRKTLSNFPLSKGNFSELIS